LTVAARTRLDDGRELESSIRLIVENLITLEVAWPGRAIDADGKDKRQ
jgi:hypothetical protein